MANKSYRCECSRTDNTTYIRVLDYKDPATAAAAFAKNFNTLEYGFPFSNNKVDVVKITDVETGEVTK